MRNFQVLITIFLFAAIVFGMVGAVKETSIGLSLRWESIGGDVEINYIRTENGQNEQMIHTIITKASPANYAFLPGDVDGIPKWMEVEWQYGIIDGKTYEEEHKYARHAKAYFDLKALIPSEYIEEIERDKNRKQLRLVGTFKEDKLGVRAEVFQWRK